MLLLSKTTDTRIGARFNVTNMDVAGFTATVKINAKDYPLSPVANGAVGTATIPAADAQAISTKLFGAQITVADADGKTYQVSGWPGTVVENGISGLVENNIASLQILPPFPVPKGDGGGGSQGTEKYSVISVECTDSEFSDLPDDEVLRLTNADLNKVEDLATSEVTYDLAVLEGKLAPGVLVEFFWNVTAASHAAFVNQPEGYDFDALGSQVNLGTPSVVFLARNGVAMNVA